MASANSTAESLINAWPFCSYHNLLLGSVSVGVMVVVNESVP